MKILFAGTPDFSVPILQALLDANHDVCAVYTQPDRPKGRGQKTAFSPVKSLAVEHGLPVEQPQSLKNLEAQQQLARYQADVMVVVAYGLILPKAVLDIPKYGCINVHASLLPKYRGASPIQAAILAGDELSGVTIMQMDVGLDTGDMIIKKSCVLAGQETAQSLHDKLSVLGAEAINDALRDIVQGTAQFESQEESLASYAGKIQKEQARIDWSNSAIEIDRQIRAFNPWPVCYSHLDDKTVRIWQASVVEGAETKLHQAGDIISLGKDYCHIACGEGVLSIERLQLAGSKAMSIKDCLNAKRSLFEQVSFQ